MTNPLQTPEAYELFLYGLPQQFHSIHRSTLAFVRRGASLARITGDLYFDAVIRLVVRERVIFDRLPSIIDWYGYEVWDGGEKLYWYGPQPHPNDPQLQITHPHHKHVPPEIKHNRIPAPEMRFDYPNLPTLIHEIKALISFLIVQG